MRNQKTPSRHKARKRFGQNFLVADGVIHQIVHSIAPKEADCIVEIGPGQGALTKPLLYHTSTLQVIELDRDLIPVLLAQFANFRDFKIHQADALKFDYAMLFNAGNKLRIVGNLPYNISTQLIFHLCHLKHMIKDMHFMLQKEVAERLVAGPGGKNYGRLSIMAQYHCHIESLFDVPPECFEPAPKVNSAVVRLTPHAEIPIMAKNLSNLELLVKTAFQQRRKTLRNGLKNLVSCQQAETAGLDLSLRAENLSLRQYVETSNTLWGEKPMRSHHE